MAYYPRPNRNHVKVKSEKFFSYHSKTVNNQSKPQSRIVELPSVPQHDSSEFYAQAASRLFSAINHHNSRKQYAQQLFNQNQI